MKIYLEIETKYGQYLSANIKMNDNNYKQLRERLENPDSLNYFSFPLASLENVEVYLPPNIIQDSIFKIYEIKEKEK